MICQVAAADGLGFFLTEAAGAGLAAVVGHGFVIRQVLLHTSPADGATSPSAVIGRAPPGGAPFASHIARRTRCGRPLSSSRCRGSHDFLSVLCAAQQAAPFAKRSAVRRFTGCQAASEVLYLRPDSFGRSKTDAGRRHSSSA